MTHTDVVDDESLKRFLCGLAGDSEREEIERMILDDAAFEDRVTALDEELARDFFRGDLNAEMALAFKACLRASPSRMARLNETAEFMRALESVEDVPTNAIQPSRAAWWLWTAAAAAAVALLAVWIPRQIAPRGQPSTSGPPPAADVEVAFRLAGDATRSTETGQNLLRPEPRVTAVRFQGEITAPANDTGSLRGELRIVGGAPVPVASRPELRRHAEKTEIDWVVPRRLLVPGDYILSVRVERADNPEELGSWFFSVLGTRAGEPNRR